MRSARGWSVVVAVLAVAISGLWLQARRLAVLREEVARRQSESARLDELRRENERLRAKVAQPVLLDKGGTEAVRQRVAALKRQLDLRTSRPKAPTPWAVPPASRLIEGAIIPASEWKNAGRATPESALETALWAAAGGDVETLAAGIAFVSDRAQAAAQALLESLPPDARARYQTPERLVAALSIPEVPTGSVEVRHWADAQAPFAAVEAQFSGQDGKSKTARLLMRFEADGWKLMVGEPVVAKYVAQLKASPATAATSP